MLQLINTILNNLTNKRVYVSDIPRLNARLPQSELRLQLDCQKRLSHFTCF